MIAQILKSNIESFYARISGENPMFKRAEDGDLSLHAIATYVENVRHLICHTPVHLQLARRHAELQGLPALAAFFEKKLQEEVGHDKWANDDLAAIGDRALATAGRVVPAMDALIENTASRIEEEPRSYLAYIFFSEYFTVLGAPSWVRNMSKCGVPKGAMSVIEKHGELDKEHSGEMMEVIDALVSGDDIAQTLRADLVEYMRFFEAFCTEIGELN